MARATSTKSWLWHQPLSHLNFDTRNILAINDLVTGVPKFKYHKEHLCPSCEQGKSKRASHPPKLVPNSKQRLHLLHMDLCGPMRIASINGKPYVLVTVDKYSRYTWVHFLRSKDEAPENSKIKSLRYFDSVGISHQASSVRTPQQNGVVERRNRTLVEAARTMLIFSRAPLFLWAEAIATACYTQNRSIIHRRFNKTPYELINGRKPDISFLHVFGALCYPKNDREDIGKLGAKGDIGFFIGYSADSCAYRVYNRRTKKIMETMNVTFDELSASSVRTPQQNGVVERRNRTLVEAARTMLIFSCAPLFLLAEAIATAKPDISFLHVFGALCYPKNDREDIGKLGAKGDIGFFIGYSADSCAYRVYNRRTKKIMETMNVTFDELSAMAFEQSSSKPGPQRMTSGQISSGLDLTYAPSTITTQKPTEGELDLLFEAMYDDYIGGQPSSAPRTAPDAQAPQALHTPTATTTTADTAPTPTNSSSQATNCPNSSQDVDELETQQHGQHQPATTADNVPNALFDENTFVNPFATPSTSDAEPSSSQYDHPSEQVIGEPSRPVLTRNQLRSDGDMCMYALTVSTVEPKNVKEAMTDPAWIESMQEELLQFKRLDVWVLVPLPITKTLTLKRMEACDPVGTPNEIKDKLDLDQNGSPVDATKYRSMIGALMYLTSSRPDIVHATCLCARYQAKPTEKHLKEVKRIFRYLRGTVNTGLWYTKDSGFELTGFSDADYAGCKDTFKSTSGGAQFLGEKLVSWSSKKQDCTALSTAEAEYVSLSVCCAQVLWMRTQLTDYGFHFNKKNAASSIYCDSKSAIAISCNPVQHSRTKHITVRYHFIKEHVEKGTIELYFVKTDYQLADLFTKALPVDRFNYLVRRLGMRSLSPKELERLAKSQ
ncbi:retrovirus-related pol polyprotein from transposon TNT 1-94 [Tanacetum coccineum]|uniref:Retrovirus-related pol polyprotein from transposon TNT 1-94 n=1 Tax=Tanacetum coccineum TaxID=301880 RepID=A0ABQ5A3R7_9ASTR